MSNRPQINLDTEASLKALSSKIDRNRDLLSIESKNVEKYIEHVMLSIKKHYKQVHHTSETINNKHDDDFNRLQPAHNSQNHSVCFKKSSQRNLTSETSKLSYFLQNHCGLKENQREMRSRIEENEIDLDTHNEQKVTEDVESLNDKCKKISIFARKLREEIASNDK